MDPWRVAAALLLALLIILPIYYIFQRSERPGGAANQTDINDNASSNQDEVPSWPGLRYHGYFRVIDSFVSAIFSEELAEMGGGGGWEANAAHIVNAARQSNMIVVPHSVENPRAYLYDAGYTDACIESGLDIVLLVHTLAKYIYFEDPRPCSDQERKELFEEELRVYEKEFRKHKDEIIAVYLYDEPWVSPYNVTHAMLIDMAESARTILWGKPILVMFHRQGNTLSYADPNGTLVRFDDWAGNLPSEFDVVGVDPYYYAYHRDEPPEFRRTGDQGMVESDVIWACSFSKPVMLVGQAYDPGGGLFFERDNTDPRIRIEEDFEGPAGTISDAWSVLEGEVSISGSAAYHGERSLLLEGVNGSELSLEFPEVHSVGICLNFATDLVGDPLFWIVLGSEVSEPVRLGVAGNDLLINDGSRTEVVNASIDVVPGVWHSLEIRADVDADRWVVWFDGDRQGRLPHAAVPISFSRLKFIRPTGSARVWIDEVCVAREWSSISLNESETMLYYQVARKYPQVEMLLWWAYPDSFASHLVRERERYQVADIWTVQREIWEMIQ